MVFWSTRLNSLSTSPWQPLHQISTMDSLYLLLLSRLQIIFFPAFLVSALISQFIFPNRLSVNNSLTLKITDFRFHLLSSSKGNVIHAMKLLCWEVKYYSFSREIPKDTHWEDTTLKDTMKAYIF